MSKTETISNMINDSFQAELVFSSQKEHFPAEWSRQQRTVVAVNGERGGGYSNPGGS